jgi:hypothetical protein
VLKKKLVTANGLSIGEKGAFEIKILKFSTKAK